MKKFNSILASILALALIVTACGPSKEKSEDDSDEFDEAEKSLQQKLPDVVNNLPPPTEIPYLLQSTGAEFNGSLINDKKMAPQYNAKTEKAALNLGIY